MPSDGFLTALLGAVVAGFSVMGTVIGFLWRENAQLRKDLDKNEEACQRRISELERQVLTLQVQSEMAEKFTGNLPTQGQITVEARTGMIREWNPGATAILHWTAREMMGQPLRKIIPAKYTPDHLTAMAKMVNTSAAPKHGPHKLVATRRDGSFVRVLAYYAGYQDGADYIVVATITERTGFPNPDSDGSKIEVDSDVDDSTNPKAKSPSS